LGIHTDLSKDVREPTASERTCDSKQYIGEVAEGMSGPETSPQKADYNARGDRDPR